MPAHTGRKGFDVIAYLLVRQGGALIVRQDGFAGSDRISQNSGKAAMDRRTDFLSRLLLQNIDLAPVYVVPPHL